MRWETRESQCKPHRTAKLSKNTTKYLKVLGLKKFHYSQKSDQPSVYSDSEINSS